MSDTVRSTNTVTLSEFQACALSRLLDKLLSQAGDNEIDLVDFWDRLSDSLWLARWLGETVSVEVNAGEILDLLEALTVMLDEGRWTDQDCEALQAVVERLTSATSMPASVGSIAKTPSASRQLLTKFREWWHHDHAENHRGPPHEGLRCRPANNLGTTVMAGQASNMDLNERSERSWSYEEAFSRNLGLISPEEQERLRNSRVAIAGMGGVGAFILSPSLDWV